MLETLEELTAAVADPGHPDAERDRRLHALAADIRRVGTHREAPSRLILIRLGDRWSSLMLSVLATGRYRYAELHRAIDYLNRIAPDTPISQRMLTLSLRQLERDGLVERLVDKDKSHIVEYGLTSLGWSLHEKLRAVVRWADDHSEAITQAQRDFDAKAEPSTTIRRHHLR